ncbi:MAG TPA: hypothetical protein PLD48_02650 [Bacillota bacterium]|nr:hypothetical protein [Bacillota bacterium]HOK69047.1 hypothetical protein [Bacillota bacterium]HPP85824.1 hypothetical protein [Bacillota bacterium]
MKEKKRDKNNVEDRNRNNRIENKLDDIRFENKQNIRNRDEEDPLKAYNNNIRRNRENEHF